MRNIGFLQLATLLATFGLMPSVFAQTPPNIPANIGTDLQRNLSPQTNQGFLDIQRVPQDQNFFYQNQQRFEREVRILTEQNSNPGTILVIRDQPIKQNNRLAIEQEQSPNQRQKAPNANTSEQ